MLKVNKSKRDINKITRMCNVLTEQDRGRILKLKN